MILLIDPLNPLGSGYPRAEVHAIAEIAHDHHLTILNDVTYRDFSPEPTLAAEFAPDDTVTVWSASKNCGLAGLRIGGFSARPELRKTIARFNTNDLGVNILAQVAALAALKTKPQWLPGVVGQTRLNFERVAAAARSVRGVTVPVSPSWASMTILDVSGLGLAPEAIQEEMLLRHGVFVRAGNYLSPHHGSKFVRVSFSNPPSDIDRFVAAFPESVNTLRTRTTTPPAA